MNTMNRCLLSCLVAAPLLAAGFAASTAAAQPSLPTVERPLSTTPPGGRHLPSHAQVGVLRIDQAPHAQINGQPIRTAPGFRLFSADNKLIFAHTVQSQALTVAYVREASTKWLLTAWILTPEEASRLTAKR